MRKAILVIDMPKSCDECPLMFRHEEERCCWAEGRNSFTTKPGWCPLKAFPVRDDGIYSLEYSNGYQKGWNDCIKYLDT